MADSGRYNTAGGGTLSVVRCLRDLPSDSPAKAIIVTLVVCIVASAVVTVSAVLLRPKQIANKQLEERRQIAEILKSATHNGDAWRDLKVTDLETRVVELASGKYVDGIDPATFDQRRMARDPAQSIEIPSDKDVAQIKTRAKHAVVHLLIMGSKVKLIILPIYGRGFGSTLYGYIGLSGEAETVIGLAFYEHGETPGLGALIDDPAWRKLWSGKKVWGAGGEVSLGVARGPVVPGTEEAEHQVDGLTGATWTGQGVTNLLRYWLGEHGFGPYLNHLRRAGR